MQSCRVGSPVHKGPYCPAVTVSGGNGPAGYSPGVITVYGIG